MEEWEEEKKKGMVGEGERIKKWVKKREENSEGKKGLYCIYSAVLCSAVHCTFLFQ